MGNKDNTASAEISGALPDGVKQVIASNAYARYAIIALGQDMWPDGAAYIAGVLAAVGLADMGYAYRSAIDKHDRAQQAHDEAFRAAPNPETGDDFLRLFGPQETPELVAARDALAAARREVDAAWLPIKALKEYVYSVDPALYDLGP